MKGRLIAICGIDGSGKTTQEELLSEYLTLRGVAHIVTKQPTDFYRKMEPVRRYLDHGDSSINMEGMALLAAGDRQHHLESTLLPALSDGQFVICNRYVYSTYAYFMERGISLKFLEVINRNVPTPDLTILLDSPAALSRERVTARDGEINKYEERKLRFMESVRTNFLSVRDDSFLTLDARLPAEHLHQSIRLVVDKWLPRDRCQSQGSVLGA